MTLLNLLPCYFFFLIHLLITVYAINSDLSSTRNVLISKHDSKPKKLFVFGDSYADTGNIVKSQSPSWKKPYGITFPGKPAGRFSDGRVLTDYIGNYVFTLYRLSFHYFLLSEVNTWHALYLFLVGLKFHIFFWKTDTTFHIFSGKLTQIQFVKILLCHPKL